MLRAKSWNMALTKFFRIPRRSDQKVLCSLCNNRFRDATIKEECKKRLSPTLSSGFVEKRLDRGGRSDSKLSMRTLSDEPRRRKIFAGYRIPI